MDITDIVLNYFSANYAYYGEICEKTLIKEDIGLDSLDYINLALNLESIFNIHIKPIELVKETKSIGDLIKLIFLKIEHR